MRRSLRRSLRARVLASALVAGACGEATGTDDGAIATNAGSGGVGFAGASGSFAGAGTGAGAGAGAAGSLAAGTGAAGASAGGTGAGGGGASAAGAGGMQATAGTSGAGGMDGASGASGGGGASGEGGASGGGGTSGEGGASGDGGGGGPLAKFCGNITTGGRVRSDFIQYWDQITPENEGKWGSVEGVRDQMNWGGLDAAYQYAQDNDIPFKQHTFVWGSQQPGWIGGLSESEQRAEVEEWIRLYCERYPETEMIDVVNEPPPHTTPAYAAALGGAGASGYDWIVQAFEWADQYCPNAILILNDYNTIEYGNDNSRFIDIVNRIMDAGAPIDAIGAQAHAAYDIPTATVQMYLDRLAETGLPIYISEYDINLANDDQQRQVMETQFTMFWNRDDVVGVTLWGYIEGQTWLANSGLMTSGGEMRPAMTWLMEFLDR